MRFPQLPAAALFFCLLLQMDHLQAAPPGHPDQSPSLPMSDHENLAAAGGKAGERENQDSVIREERSPEHESEEEEDLFQGVDPRALAAVLLQALDHPASPPAPGVLQQQQQQLQQQQLQPPPPPQQQQQQQAEALLTETVRSQTHSHPAPEIGISPTLSRIPDEHSSEGLDPSGELEALESLLQELRSFNPGNAKREPEAAAAEAETHTHTLTRVNLESPGPERVWRASWGEFQARVPPALPFLRRFQEQLPEGVSLPEVRQGEREPSLKARQSESIAPLYKARQMDSAPFSKTHRPESAAVSRLAAGGRLLQRGLAQVEAGRRQAEATRQAAAQEERLADLASDLLLQYLLQGGGGDLERGVGDRGLQGEGEEERERERVEEEGEIRGREEEEDDEQGDEEDAEAEAEEVERGRQNALLFAEEEGEAGAEDKRSQEETPGQKRKGQVEGEGEEDEEEMDPQTIDSLIELSTKLHLPADDVVSIIEEVEEKRKRKKNAPPEPLPLPRAPPAPTHFRSPKPPPPPSFPAQDELQDWNEVLPPWDREEVLPPEPNYPFPNYIQPRTLLPPLSTSSRRHYYHAQPAEGSRYHFGLSPQGRRGEEEERKQQEEEELENYIEHVLLRRPGLFP